MPRTASAQADPGRPVRCVSGSTPRTTGPRRRVEDPRSREPDRDPLVRMSPSCRDGGGRLFQSLIVGFPQVLVLPLDDRLRPQFEEVLLELLPTLVREDA